VEARIGKRRIGFGEEILGVGPEEVGEDEEVARNRDLSKVEPEDLQRFGLIPELVGRLPVLVSLEDLDEESLVRILQEPKNAVLKQYARLLELEEVGLTFEPEAVRAIARKTLKRGTGARGLRAVIEEVMRDVMFDVPSRKDVREVVVTAEAVERGITPLLVFHNPPKKKKEA
jgi:ATP-dependent Clp protease ATP-binding subunit ClpX